ncbi:MAG TPA: hypothetical protein VJR94_02980 [Candidatus Nitrosocosmicus sp.]|nr:hypothetical protein [Candidatus Nitrosocosmicus sp.]
MFNSEVKTPTELEQFAVINTLKLEFRVDPVTHWVRPDPRVYLKYYPKFARTF